MKKIFLIAVLVSGLAVPVSGFAFSKLRLNSFVGWGEDMKECEAELEFTSSQGGLISGLEEIRVNGVKWAGLDQLSSFSGYSVGDKVSFGTLKLSARLSYNFDVTLDETECEMIQNGDDISVTDSGGTVTETWTLGAVGLQMAYALDSNQSVIELDLNDNSLAIRGLTADTTIGSGPLFTPFSGTGNGSSCSLIGVGSTGTSAPIVAMFGLTLFALWRKRS